jgi:hypothetical protein
VLINSEANFVIPKGTDCQGWKLEVPSWHFTLEEDVPWGEGVIPTNNIKVNIGRNIRTVGYTLPYYEMVNKIHYGGAGWMACGVPYPNVYLVAGFGSVSEWLPPYPDLPWMATTQK